MYNQQRIVSFAGDNPQSLFEIPDRFGPFGVVGNGVDGLWTILANPPGATPAGPYPWDVVRIDPATGKETVPTTLQGIPVTISQLPGLTTGQGVFFNGSLFVLEPPFHSNGYLGYSELIKLTPSDL